MTGERITLDDIDVADIRYAVLALDKHTNHREQEGHEAAARKYRDAADEFRRRADQVIEGGLFGQQDEKKFAENEEKRERSTRETSIER